MNSQHPSAHFHIAKDDGQRDDDKVNGASNILEDEEDEDGVVPLGQGEMGASMTSNSEKGVRLENIPYLRQPLSFLTVKSTC